MKKLKLHFFALAVILAATSCSKDDAPESTGSTPVNDDPISGMFQKNVLIEDYTGTWCGWCPRVAYSIQQVENVTTKSVAVAVHGGSASEPMRYTGSLPIDIQGYPTGMLDRTVEWVYPENTHINQAKNLAKNNSGLGLAMNSTVSGGTIDLNVKIKFAQDVTNAKLVVYLVEDNLVYDQTNYTSYFGGGATIANFDHDNVLRQTLTSITGDALTGTTASQTITKNFNLPIPANVTNAANIHFVAFVTGSNGGAINVRKAAPNTDQAFEVNP
ncbi:Omp28-related outer membrane protein [Flavobacterium humi]|uniref:Omp28-related outer membrane protein n=1 Tax=Flavobacterium humi TaxID=2562683 RepID=A0A4Z0LAD3_9FLAO|nr:Omp28-related outer membrane protein [Flavobacterium humi]TGD58018.1 Omp28-related outer membrane protein [Flavobacterium humi]